MRIIPADLKSLRFGNFIRPGSSPPERLFTNRSLDIVSHETGHAGTRRAQAQLDSQRYSAQTGALHESFGDITAIFLSLSQLDEVEAIIAQTKGNLHDKNFLSDLAEQFGLSSWADLTVYAMLTMI